MEPLVWGLVSSVGTMTAFWVASVVRQNASYVDRAWGAMFPILAATYLITADRVTPRAIVVAVLASLWGARLAVHLTVRGWGAGEEWRHREARAQHPRTFPFLSLATLFLPQAVAAVAVSTPLLASLADGQPSGVRALDVLGAAGALAGLIIETVADWQLLRHRRRSAIAGAVLDTGLWRYSRHPNYFGDALMWWGLGLIGLAAGPVWALLGPAGMTVVLLYGTGALAMDQHMLATRGAEYASYVARTSGFVPRPPRLHSGGGL